MRLQLAVLASLFAFAGSIAGFQLSVAPDASGRDARANPPGGTAQTVRVTGDGRTVAVESGLDCPSWEAT